MTTDEWRVAGRAKLDAQRLRVIREPHSPVFGQEG
jgi:hypothetical protein